MNTYTTSQGDMWDSIAYRLFGSTDYTDDLMNANQQYRDLYSFPAGVVLNVPAITEASTASTLPPWKQVSA